MNNSGISAAFPYDSHYVDVNGSRMHYIDEGQGKPIVFLHGIPSSSYLWRNVIPYLTEHGRCIALDLIGCGLSDKPKIDYSVNDYLAYFKGFLQALDLDQVTLVMHGWGSVIGFDYAMSHQDNVNGLAFLESHFRANTDWDMLSLPIQQIMSLREEPAGGQDKIINSNYFMENVFPLGVLRKLSNREMDYYQAPFLSPNSRQVIWQYLQELPIGDKQKGVTDFIQAYSEKLQQSDLPKLLLYAVPGFITTIDTVCWAKQHLPNLTSIDIGEALHYAQETKPELIGMELRDWYLKVI